MPLKVQEHFYKQPPSILIRILICLLCSCHLLAAEKLFQNFPQINQREIEGAEFRCGSVALGSWLIWLSENGQSSLSREKLRYPENIFAQAEIALNERIILSEIDQVCGGTSEIKILRMVEALVEYIHGLPDQSYAVDIEFLNLPSEQTLKALLNQRTAIILIHGIYQTNPSTGQLGRVTGHYTCLLGYKQNHLIANTYGNNYTFNLVKIPMSQLTPNDRYRPLGGTSLVYLHYPSANYPRYRFKSFSAADPDNALLQRNHSSQLFAEPDQSILLEGALSFKLR